MNEGSKTHVPSRRNFLQMTLAGTVVGLAASSLELANPSTAWAQSALSPDAALAELMDGNKRLTSNRLVAHEHDLDILKRHTVDKQEPFAAVLSCAQIRECRSRSFSIRRLGISL